jgi:septal ring factor EnvC (AmiA/AmiB activator)
LGRFFSAILVILITTFLALLAGASALISFGYTPDMPRQLDAAQAQLATVQAQSDALQAQNSALQTEVAAQAQRYGTDHEALGEISTQLTNIADLRNTLREERQQSAGQNATLVAEARDSSNAVAIFATVEAGRAVLLAELDRRSARVERFLQRLSDISSDTALDLGATQAPVPPTFPPAQTTISELSPTPTLAPTSIPTDTSVPTSTSVSTEPATPSATARRQSPTVISEPSPTPTLGR